MQRAEFFIVALLFMIGWTTAASNNDISKTVNHISQLQRKIQHNIDNLNNRIPRIATNLNTNIQRISTKSKIPEIITTLENQIPQASGCGADASNFISSLKSNSRADISQCTEEAVGRGGSLIQQAGRLLQKTTQIRSDVTGRIANCVKNNIPNEVNLVLCLVAQVYPIEESLASLEQEIESTLGVTEQTAQDIIVRLIQCISGFEDIIEEESRKIMKRYQTCTNISGLNPK